MKLKQLFESTPSKKEVEHFLIMHHIKNYTINDNLTVDVDGDVYLNLKYKNTKKDVTENIPIQFGKVSGDFSCGGNKLTTLEGAPREVGGGFYCSVNRLTSLQGAPQKIGKDFNCENNRLTTLDGAPSKVDGFFKCGANLLSSLQGAPSEVGGDFYCDNNQLTSLDGIGNVHGQIKSDIK